MNDHRAILSVALRAFVGEFTGFTPSAALCDEVARSIVTEAEATGSALLLTVEQCE